MSTLAMERRKQRMERHNNREAESREANQNTTAQKRERANKRASTRYHHLNI